MRYRIADGLADDGAARTWSDSLGRSVAVPGEIRRVAPYGPYAQALMESIDPGMVVQVTARGLHASVAASATALDEEPPDVILDVAVREGRLRTAVDAQADDSGVPIVHLVVAPGELPAAYRALGKLLGRQDRCDELADYVAAIDVTLAQVREQVPESERKRVYFGQGPYGLYTRGENTLLDYVFDAVGCFNISSDISQGCYEVSAENVLKKCPDAIILEMHDVATSGNTEEYRSYLWSEGLFAGDAEVYKVPLEPYSWLNSSPLIVQTIGALWLAETLYPTFFTGFERGTALSSWEKLFGLEVATSTLSALSERANGNISKKYFDSEPAFCAVLGENQFGLNGYEVPSVQSLSSNSLAYSVASVNSGGGSVGGGSTGGASLTVGSEISPLSISAGVKRTFKSKTVCWLKCEIDGASHIIIETGGTKCDVTVKITDTAQTISGTYTQQSGLDGRFGHYGRATYIVGIVTAVQANVSCTISQNIDTVNPIFNTYSRWTYDGLSAADVNILYDQIWLCGPDQAAVLYALTASNIYEEREEEVEEALMAGGATLAGFVEDIILSFCKVINKTLIGEGIDFLIGFGFDKMQVDVRRELQDQIEEKSNMDNGCATYGVAVYKALVGTMGVRRYRVDRWADFDTDGDGAFTEGDSPSFGAPSGSRGEWECIERQ